MHRHATIAIVAALCLLTAAASAPAAKKNRQVSEDVVKKITEAAPAEAPAKPAKDRKLLVYSRCKGFRHGSIPYGAKALEVLGKKTGAYEVVVNDDDAIFTPEKLKAFDAVCINNATTRWKADGPEMAALKGFVEAGGGLVGIHAATDGTAGRLFGGLFSGHPWHQNVAIKNDDPDHPVNAAFEGKGFEVKDEIYQFRKIYSREKLRVLLSLDMTKVTKRGGRRDNDYAVSWVRSLGKGRVFYCSLGHRNEIFWNPAILKHYLAGVQFALGDLEADTTPSGPVETPKAPAFTLTDQNGKKVSLSDFDGKIVVLEWINWNCPYVKRHHEAGTMKKLAAKYAGKGVVWLGVNSTKGATAAQNRKAAEQYGLGYPVLDDSDGKVGRSYGARTTPHMFIIDAAGAIAYDGAIDDDPKGKKDKPANFVARALNELLAGKDVSKFQTRPYGCTVKYAK